MTNAKSSQKFKCQKFGFWILKLICHLDFEIWVFLYFASKMDFFQILRYSAVKSSRGEMDITTVFGTVSPRSNRGGSTNSL